MDPNPILTEVEKIGDSFTDYKNLNDKALGKLTERLELIEAGSNRPKGGGGETNEQREYSKLFTDWWRNPHDTHLKNRLGSAQHELAKKDVSIGVDSSGGFALPEEISRRISARVQQLNPFRDLVRTETIGSNDFKALLSMGDATTGWSTETGTRSATVAATLRERAPTFGELYALPTASQWSLDDLFFDVESWIVREVSATFAAAEATAIVSGNGTARPTGFLNTDPAATADDASPMRAAGVLEFIGITGPASPIVLNYESIVDLVASLKERYLVGSKVGFIMNRTTLAQVRKIVDSNGQPIWFPGMVGNPANLLGYPVFTSDAMPTYAVDAFAIAFGNWEEGYLLADRHGIRVLPDPYSTPGVTRFWVSRRIGGCVYNNDAIKMLRISD